MSLLQVVPQDVVLQAVLGRLLLPPYRSPRLDGSWSLDPPARFPSRREESRSPSSRLPCTRDKYDLCSATGTSMASSTSARTRLRRDPPPRTGTRCSQIASQFVSLSSCSHADSSEWHHGYPLLLFLWSGVHAYFSSMGD